MLAASQRRISLTIARQLLNREVDIHDGNNNGATAQLSLY